MRTVFILVGAVTLGLAAGYGWSALNPARPPVRIPKPVTPKLVEAPQSASDQEWAARANAERTWADLRAALKESLKEEGAGKGKRFRNGREAIRWLES